MSELADCCARDNREREGRAAVSNRLARTASRLAHLFCDLAYGNNNARSTPSVSLSQSDY